LDRNLLIRIIIAVIFGPLIILVSYAGGFWLLGMVLLFASLGIMEFMINSGVRPSSDIFYIALVFTIAIVALTVLDSFQSGFLALVACILVVGMRLSIKNALPADLFTKQTRLIWGVTYIGLLYPFVYHIRYTSENGGDWLLFLFGTLWLSDTLAMFVGKGMGKRKLSPEVSPNKTVAGFIGGLFGGIIIALIMSFWLLSEVMTILLIAAGLLVSFIGQLGDLVESCWKRAMGIKDSSAIIPGHGGVLDRFDSLLFASPVLYWYLKYILYN
jgi:phosphatidate cytidylyltransferase